MTLIFDISSAGTLSSIDVDLGAMGDFEGTDDLQFKYSIDGGAQTLLLDLNVNQAISQTYTMEDTDTIDLDDPMTVSFGPGGGSCARSTILDNDLQTCTANMNASGSQLTLDIEAYTNATDEVLVFDHIVINGSTGNPNATKLIDSTTRSLSLLAVILAFGIALVLLGGGVWITRRCTVRANEATQDC
jgi:hypothetical protein